jgi:hypothetical protein
MEFCTLDFSFSIAISNGFVLDYFFILILLWSMNSLFPSSFNNYWLNFLFKDSLHFYFTCIALFLQLHISDLKSRTSHLFLFGQYLDSFFNILFSLESFKYRQIWNIHVPLFTIILSIVEFVPYYIILQVEERVLN